MKEVPFSLNTNNCSYDYMRVREGPNWFRCYYKNVSRKIIEPLDAWRTLGVAKHTDFGKALKAWCLEMNETYSTESRLGVPDTSFASDAQDAEATDNTDASVSDTKMIT